LEKLNQCLWLLKSWGTSNDNVKTRLCMTFFIKTLTHKLIINYDFIVNTFVQYMYSFNRKKSIQLRIKWTIWKVFSVLRYTFYKINTYFAEKHLVCCSESFELNRTRSQFCIELQTVCQCAKTMHMFSITEICVFVSATVCRCGEGRYLCGTSGVCVDRSSVCDGSKDCPDGGDKIYCRKSMFQVMCIAVFTMFISGHNTLHTSYKIDKNLFYGYPIPYP